MSQSSKWNIWDFHLHTPCSILNNGFGDSEDQDTWEKYASRISAKSQEKGIAALGITDYFTIEGYKRVLDLKKSGKLEDIFIFPNIEFRIDKVIYSTKKGSEISKRLNLHVLISPEVTPQEIEEGFLHDLDFCHEQTPFEPQNTRKLKLSNLIDFGQSLREQEPSFHDKSDIWVGCTNVVVKTEQIKERLDSRFRGNYLLVLADEDLSDMSWQGQDHAVRKQLVQMSHAIFSSNSGAREFCLGNRHSSQEDFIKEFKSLKPCLWGCDSHSYEERFLEPDDQRYCWIKSEISWEGLKQVLYEPCERVIVQADNPEAQTSSFTLEKLNIENSNLNPSLTIDNFSVELNPNLVTIIGGRGSGKTALLDMISSCFREGEKLLDLETSFIHRLYKKKGKTKPSTLPVKLSLIFKSGESYEGKIGSDEYQPFERADILYLTQNHFEEYSANPRKLNNHILELVFDNLPDYRSEYDNRQQRISRVEQEIQNINLRVEQLYKEVNEKESDLINKLKVKIGEKDDITLRVSSVEEQQGQSDIIISGLTDKLEELKGKRRRIEEIILLFQKFESQITSFDLFYRNNILRLNTEILSLENTSLKELPIELPSLKEARDCLTGNKQFLDEYKEKIGCEVVAKNQEISALVGVEKTIAELRQRLANLNIEIQEIEIEIRGIEGKKKQIEELNFKRIENYADIMKMMVGIKFFFQSIIDEFESGKDEILSNLNFLAFVNMKGRSEYVQNIADKLDNRAHSQDEVERILSKTFDSIENIFNTKIELNENNKECEIYSSVAKEIFDNLKDLRLKRSVTNSDYFNAVFQCFFELGVDISFNNKSIDSLSMRESNRSSQNIAFA